MYYRDTFKTQYSKKVSEYLLAYYKNRVEYFNRLRSFDTYAETDYSEKDFSFVHNEMKEIF